MGETLKPIRAAAGSRAAIVFIHGFGGDAVATWGRFPEWIEADKRLQDWSVFTLGYETHLSIDVVKLWSADPDLDRVALRLRAEAKAGALKDFSALCLVGHSMGGLATQRALLDDAELRRRTSHVFLYGTPSDGLAKASWVRIFKPQLRDMARDGRFIRSLREDWSARFETPAGTRLPFQFFVIGGESDEFVPAESSVGPFSEGLYGSIRSIVPARVKAVVASFIQPNAEWTCWNAVAAMAFKTANSRLSWPRMTHRIAATVAARDQGLNVARHRCRWLSEKESRFATPGAFRPGPLTFRCSTSRGVIHAARGSVAMGVECALTMQSRSGLSVTAPIGDQSRVSPDQRAGLSSRARRYSTCRAARIA